MRSKTRSPLLPTSLRTARSPSSGPGYDYDRIEKTKSFGQFGVPHGSDASPAPPRFNADEIVPAFRVNWISRLCFSWLTPLMRLGTRRPLELTDMYKLPESLLTKANSRRVEKVWAEERRGARTTSTARSVADPARPPLLQRAIWRAYGSQWLIAGLFGLINVAAQVMTPVVLEQLLRYMQDGAARPESSDGYLLAFSLFVLQCLATFSNSLLFYRAGTLGVTLRSSLVSLIFSKSLRLTAEARAADFDNGKITNTMSTDTARVETMVLQAHLLWVSLLQISIVLALLVRLVGLGALAGVALMVVVVPVQARLMRALAKYRRESQRVTDQRVKTVTELVEGMRMIKMLAWGQVFRDAVLVLRKREVGWLRKLALWKAVITGVAQVVPAFVATVVFAVYYALGHELTPAVVFPALTLFSQLRLPITLLPTAFTALIDAQVAMDRITALLEADELDTCPAMIAGATDSLNTTKPAVAVDHADFAWVSGIPSLTNVSLAIPRGALVAVIGATGSGKSTLLSGLMGELHVARGTVQVSARRVAYCPQHPWVHHGTVRDNVVFGRAFDAAQYRRAIRLAALDRDLAVFPAGDRTEIGERGSTLSGGQLARMGLARALYDEPDVLLLDDPTSAVDARVASFLFRHTLAGAELKGSTRIVVTNALHFVPLCDYAVVVKDGTVAEQGSVADLLARDGELAREMHALRGSAESDASDTESVTSAAGILDTLDPPDDGDGKAPTMATAHSPANGALMQSEERSTGAVAWAVYRDYLEALGGARSVAVILASLVLVQAFRVGGDLWLSAWTANSLHLPATTYLGAYFGWAVVQAAASVVYVSQFALAGLRASRAIHDQAVERIVRLPLAFFETTPLGRIVSRFSKDQDQLDTTLVDASRMFLNTLATVLSTLMIIVVASPLFAAPLVPLLAVYYVLQRFYRATSIDLRRLEALSRSTLYARFTESLAGASVIRAYAAQRRFLTSLARDMDVNNRPAFLTICAQRWLAIRIQSIGNVLVLAAALLGVTSTDPARAAMVGLSLTYALQVTASLSWCVRQAAETEQQMNATERLLHYANKLVTEADDVIEGAVPKDWPMRGEVVMQDVTMAYRAGLEPVLRGVSLRIPAGCKCAIVGRSGAGKSSLVAALFRLTELTSGSVCIDGIDVSGVGLADLRSRIAIIPQQPFLFSGTIRANLDPCEQVDDAVLWDCLDRAGIRAFVESQQGHLDALVQAEGLSLGQQQLLCLARALVHKSRILVMDEATAAMDQATDAIVQDVIRREFASATVVTIAHRLNTIIDYDMIVVMAAGRVAEIGAPADLLARPGSQFAALVDETGPSNAALLRRVALSDADAPAEQE
ncbi:hypothetical protein AMAG_10458 [Allomyces macrogynus ATCC 38327]|uniref:Uncharacterized protein n=2 Tax=Allomyces macrogynus (strain ATCC 38327) TaxID=578462 RepID=A0A0L0SV05_ALLM3|nr:hypothetical protein AMAG_10458 [Allomyces macrogynus ATCC 38327]|eukprot:KNE66220.1 hypothetical protein AMAG_10458 [Allomyces macrogynus ATCC 38327]